MAQARSSWSVNLSEGLHGPGALWLFSWMQQSPIWMIWDQTHAKSKNLTPRSALAVQLDATISNLEGLVSKTSKSKIVTIWGWLARGRSAWSAGCYNLQFGWVGNKKRNISKILTIYLRACLAQGRSGWSARCYNLQFGWFGIEKMPNQKKYNLSEGLAGLGAHWLFSEILQSSI